MDFFTKTIRMSGFALLLMNVSVTMCMNLAQKPKITNGKLFIDHQHRIKRNCLSRTNVEYVPQGARKHYPFANGLTSLAPETPFVKVIIQKDQTNEEIYTIFPATQLINCSNGSIVHLKARNHEYHLTCSENYILIIKEKYLPTDEKITGFEKQYLASMNHFYSGCTYLGTKRHQKEFRKNDVLTMIGQIHRPGRPPKTMYSHGPKGCGTENDLMKLSINEQKRMVPSSGKNMFSYVMARQHAPK